MRAQSEAAIAEAQALLFMIDARVGVTLAGMPLLDALLAELVPDDLVSA